MNETIKLAKFIEYVESYGYTISESITASKLNDYKFHITKKINSQPISKNRKEIALKLLNESIKNIRAAIAEKNKKKLIRDAKKWLEKKNEEMADRNIEIDERVIQDFAVTDLPEVDEMDILDQTLDSGEASPSSLSIDSISKVVDMEETVVGEVHEADSETHFDMEGTDIEGTNTEMIFVPRAKTRRTSYSFNRENNGNFVQIIEITEDGLTINVGEVELTFSKLDNDTVSTYIILEENNNGASTEIDYLYGEIDLDGLAISPLRYHYINSVLARRLINSKIRAYCNVLPEFIMTDENTSVIQWNKSTVADVSTQILEDAYIGTPSRITFKKDSKKTSNNPFEKDPNIGILGNLKNYATRNADNSPKKIKSEANIAQTVMAFATRNVEKTDDRKVVFFKSGMIVLEDKVCDRYSYYIESPDNTGKRELHSFLISGVDEEKLLDDEYRQNFINGLCNINLLKKVQSQEYPYLGEIAEDGTLEENKEIQRYFKRLNNRGTREIDE